MSYGKAFAEELLYFDLLVNNNCYITTKALHRVMQLNLLHFRCICQMIPLKLWPKTVLGCNHQSTLLPQLQLFCSAALEPIFYPEGMKARVSPVQF